MASNDNTELLRLIEILREVPNDEEALRSTFSIIRRKLIQNRNDSLSELEISEITRAYEQMIINFCDPRREPNFSTFKEMKERAETTDVEVLKDNLAAVCRLVSSDIMETLYKESLTEVVNDFLGILKKEE